MAMAGLVSSLIFGVSLALFGWFHPTLTWLAAIPLFGSLSLALYIHYRAQDWSRIFIIGGLVLLATLTVWRAEPTVFSGRDQGSIALAAWELAQGHELAFRTSVSEAFFAIYGPGQALNFPGFAYTPTGALITQFPLAYTTFLALFVSWFGLTGLLIANATLFICSGWSFFELCSLFVTRKNAILGTALFVTSFLTLWLVQITLTENLALTLFLLLAVALVQYEREEKNSSLSLILGAGFLLVLTRIEGFVIVPLALLFILFRPALRAKFFALPKRWAVPMLIFLAFLFLRDLFMNLPFYTMIGKAAAKFWHELGATAATRSEPPLGPVFITYGLFPTFVLGSAALISGILKKRFALIIPVLLALPTSIYLFNGHISDDHPWLLRRYAFSLYPIFLLATVVLWQSVGQRFSQLWQQRIAVGSFVVLFVLQVGPAWQSLSIIEYQTLLSQIQRFGNQFTTRDLILVDRLATGDPFAMLAGPLMSLEEKNAVYFFNPEDYAHLPRENFDHIYLLTTEDAISRFAETLGENLLPIAVSTFSFPVLSAPKPFSLPIEKTVSRDAILFEITP
jgi:hypothetical protein